MSNEDKQRVTVDIYGETYTIVGRENAEHVRHVANIVNDKMKEIKDQGPNLDTKRLAILTAVNVVNENLKLEEERDAEDNDFTEEEE